MNACKRTHKTTCRTNTDSVVHGNLSRFRKFLLFSSILTVLANPSKPHISVKLCVLCPPRMTGWPIISRIFFKCKLRKIIFTLWVSR